MINKISKNPQIAFLLIAAVYGLIFLIITPPFQVPDEGPHFYKAYSISEGHPTINKADKGAGIYIPQSILTTKEKISKNSIFSLLYLPLNPNDKKFYDISGIAIASYSPVPYIASGIIIAIGRTLNFSPLILLYLGRLANFIVWIFLTYMAIRITPIHKWVFLALALMPMTLFEATSLSADSLAIGLSFLVIAIFFKLSFDDKKIRKIDKYILLVLILFLSLSKQFYFILIFLFLLIPQYKFKDKKESIKTFLFLAIPTSIVNIIWQLIDKGLYVPSNVNGVSYRYQTYFIASNPLKYIIILINTYINNIHLYLTMLIGNLGHNIMDNPLPEWLVYSYLIILIITSLTDKNTFSINSKQKHISVIIFFSFLIIISTILYITWTPLAESSIRGIQSRYFIPIMPLLLIILYNKKININKNFFVILMTFIIVSLTISLYTIWNYFGY